MITPELLHEFFEYRDDALWWKDSIPKVKKNKPVSGSLNKGYKWLKSTLLPCQIGLHRAIWMINNGDIPDGMVVDHIDRNPLNNSLSNLRLAERSQNCLNAKGKSNKKSGLPKNVFIDWSYGGITKYRLQTLINGVAHRVGNIDSVDEALLLLNDFREKHHKEFKVKDA